MIVYTTGREKTSTLIKTLNFIIIPYNISSVSIFVHRWSCSQSITIQLYLEVSSNSSLNSDSKIEARSCLYITCW